MQINEYYTRNLDNAMHFAYHARVNRLMEKQTFATAKLAEAKTAYAEAFAREDTVYGLLRKDSRTNQLKELDAKRDQYYTTLTATLRALAKFPDATKAGQAQMLLDVAKVYDISVRDAYDRESSKLTNLGQDLTGKYAETVSALGLTANVEGLIQANDAFIKLFDERLDDQTAKELAALKNARAEVDEAYARLVALINACALLEDEATYAEVIQKINGYIVDSRRRAHKKASSAGNSGGSSAGDGTAPGEDDDAEGGDTPEGENPEGGNTPGGDNDNGGSSGSGDKEDSIG